MTARLTGIPVLCALFVLFWSSGFVGAKFGLDYSGTFTILFWRYLLVVFVLGALVTIRGQWQRMLPRDLVRHAAVGALAHAGWLAAVFGAIDLGLSAGLVAFLTALQPIMTGAFSAQITGEPVAKREWAGLVLGLVAVAIVIGDGISLGGSIVAHVLPILAVMSITVAALVDRSATVSGESPVPLLLVKFLHSVASLAVLTPLAVGLEGLEAEWNRNLVYAVVWLALFGSLAAYGLMFVLLRRLPATRVASLTYLSPPVTMVMAWMFFGETLTFTHAIGLGVAAVSVGLTLTSRRPETAK